MLEIMLKSTLSVIAILSRAVPSGTVGGRIALMSEPWSRICAAIATARALSPIITGRIWEPLPLAPVAAAMCGVCKSPQLVQPRAPLRLVLENAQRFANSSRHQRRRRRRIDETAGAVDEVVANDSACTKQRSGRADAALPQV